MSLDRITSWEPTIYTGLHSNFRIQSWHNYSEKDTGLVEADEHHRVWKNVLTCHGTEMHKKRWRRRNHLLIKLKHFKIVFFYASKVWVKLEKVWVNAPKKRRIGCYSVAEEIINLSMATTSYNPLAQHYAGNFLESLDSGVVNTRVKLSTFPPWKPFVIYTLMCLFTSEIRLDCSQSYDSF